MTCVTEKPIERKIGIFSQSIQDVFNDRNIIRSNAGTMRAYINFYPDDDLSCYVLTKKIIRINNFIKQVKLYDFYQIIDLLDLSDIYRKCNRNVIPVIHCKKGCQSHR